MGASSGGFKGKLCGGFAICLAGDPVGFPNTKRPAIVSQAVAVCTVRVVVDSVSLSVRQPQPA